MFSNEELILRRRDTNQALLAALKPLAIVYLGGQAAETLIDVDQLQRRCATLVLEAESLDAEIKERRIPHPNGATVSVYQGGSGANIAATQSIGTNSGTATGVDIGEMHA